MEKNKNFLHLTYYKNLQFLENAKELEIPKNNQRDLINFASYLAMYHPNISDFLIKKYSKEGDLIFDPFSGRGTTLFSARKLKRKGIASDLNPYSYVISKAKADKINKEACLNYLKKWEKAFLREKTVYQTKISAKEFADLRIYYADETLAMLVFMREKIGKKWKTLDPNANFLLALLTGIMHGPARQDQTTIYLSISMPNWVSMAPNYVKKYVAKKGLNKPILNLFSQLKARFENYWKYNLNHLSTGDVFLHNAEQSFTQLQDKSIDLIITSPPYLNIINYTGNNWIKLWLLGFDRKTLKKKIKLTDHLKEQEYKLFIIKILNNLHPKIKPNGKICLVVGDVYEKKLIETIWKEIAEQVNFEFDGLFYYHNKTNRKHSNALNNKRGKATKIEKILVLKKINNE